jgi:hypothetical protein
MSASREQVDIATCVERAKLRHSGRPAVGSPAIPTKCLRLLVDCLSRFGMNQAAAEGGIEKVFTSSRVERTMEQQMGRGILCWSTIALLAVGSCGNNSFAGPLEDGLAVPVEDDACTKEVVPLRKDAEERGELIRAASARRAPPDEACKLINGYAQSEIKLIRYFETSAAKCRIPPEVADQLRVSHKNTEAMRKTVCAAAQQAPGREPAGPVGDFDDVAPRRVR